MLPRVGRRELLKGGAACALLAGLSGCRLTDSARLAQPPLGGLKLTPIKASIDRITRITVCTRPFRASGPRIEPERIGQKLVVHNYSHGGSGWSLSWGSSSIAAQLALANGDRDIGVLGCGALGITSALTLLRAGASVTIYAKDLPPNVRSSLATGVWSPDSRICLEQNATPAFKQRWEKMARSSYQTYQGFLGLSGSPVEYIDTYFVSNATRAAATPDSRPPFAQLQSNLLSDLTPSGRDFRAGSHSLGNRSLRSSSGLMFNITAYTRLLLEDFHAMGGRIQVREFHSLQDLAELPQRTLINATGYGARDLFADTSITPVRGQLARLIPQPDVNYGLAYKGVFFVPRRDGLVVQATGESDYYGFDDPSVEPDRGEAERAVTTIASLFAAA